MSEFEDTREALKAAQEAGDAALVRVLEEKLSDLADREQPETRKSAKRSKAE